MNSPLSKCLLLALLACPALTRAQDRPAEDDLFSRPHSEQESPEQRRAASSPEKKRPAGEAGQAEPGDSPESRTERGAEARLLSALARTENPLQIGGVLYLRSNLSARESTPPSQWTLNAPSLTDLYLDARPTDRIRGFMLGRMQFDPTLGSSTASALGVALPGAAAASNPRVLLDQLWLQFDVAHTAFVTVGRQHVKWGVGHFWNPTDYLHAAQRDPLAVFDERTGTFMVRVGVPWEARGWNFYGMGIFEPLGTTASSAAAAALPESTGQATSGSANGLGSEAGRVGAGARAEIVLGAWELGLDGVVQRGVRPRFGIDLSGGVWELDLRGELALRTSSDVPLFRGPGPFDPSTTTYEPQGIRPMAVVGADWTHKYADEDTFTVGLEYFYNSNGYSDSSLYPLLIFDNAFTPFYLGRHYAGAYLLLPKPGSWNLHSFTFSLISNLSDRTGVARLDWSMTLLTYLRLEAYAQGHFGKSGGEFRFSLDVPPNTVPGFPSAISIGASTADVGLALRLSI
jgi:hypothetical protein